MSKGQVKSVKQELKKELKKKLKKEIKKQTKAAGSKRAFLERGLGLC